MSQLILAIETSIKDGSLALLDGAQEVDCWAGDLNTSRSSDLLPQIKRLLDQNQVSLKQVEMIAVSVGPGSFTGLRVGIATAKALAMSADCRLVGSSILESAAAYLLSGRITDEPSSVVVSAGRGQFFWQIFQGKEAAAVSEIETGDHKLLENRCESFGASGVFMEPSAYRDYQQSTVNKRLDTRLIEENFAILIGLRAFSISDTAGYEQKNREIFPVYIRPAVAKNKKIELPNGN